MTQLLVNPTIVGHSVEFGNNVISIEMDGGAARYRLDKIGSTHKVSVQWMLEEQAYNYLMAFYRTEIDYGSLPFTLAIKSVEGASSATYTARIIPGTLRLSAFLNTLYQVNATLEVTPLTINEGADQALIAAGPG